MNVQPDVGTAAGLRPVVVEVVLLRCSVDGGLPLYYRTRSKRLTDHITPDELAAQLCSDARDETQVVAVVHSTSWRFEAGVGVVLTYVALPDPDPSAPAVQLVSPTVVCSEDPRLPQPTGLHGHHVAAHAVRHLSDLLGRDPTVAEAARAAGDADLWEQVRRTAADMPTLTFRDAHPVAP